MKIQLNRRILIFIFLIIILLTANYYRLGYRLTPIQAVKTSSDIKGEIKVFGEVDRDWAKIYLLEAQNGIKTAITEKEGFLWRLKSVTYFNDDLINNDKVKTVGWTSISEENNKQITVFAAQSKDPNIKFIEAGSNSDKQRKVIRIGDTVIFTWDKSSSDLISNLNAVALDKDNSALYKYKFNPKTPNIIKTSELKWYSVNDK